MALELRVSGLEMLFKYIREEGHLHGGARLGRMQKHRYHGTFRELPPVGPKKY